MFKHNMKYTRLCCVELIQKKKGKERRALTHSLHSHLFTIVGHYYALIIESHYCSKTSCSLSMRLNCKMTANSVEKNHVVLLNVKLQVIIAFNFF